MKKTIGKRRKKVKKTLPLAYQERGENSMKKAAQGPQKSRLAQRRIQPDQAQRCHQRIDVGALHAMGGMHARADERAARIAPADSATDASEL